MNPEEDITNVSLSLMLPISKGGNGLELSIEFHESDLRPFVFVQQKLQQKMVAFYVSSIRHLRGCVYCAVVTLEAARTAAYCFCAAISSVLPKKLRCIHVGLTFQR